MFWAFQVLEMGRHHVGSRIRAHDGAAGAAGDVGAVVDAGAHALLCLNAPELVFVERVANPAVFEYVSHERALKVLVYRAPD